MTQQANKSPRVGIPTGVSFRVRDFVDEHGDLCTPLWRWKLRKRWHNLHCDECWAVYGWRLKPRRRRVTARIPRQP